MSYEYDTKKADAWCSECGDCRVVEVYIKKDGDDHEIDTICYGEETCFMCLGKMTLKEPKALTKEID
jgi:hypothetical protein